MIVKYYESAFGMQNTVYEEIKADAVEDYDNIDDIQGKIISKEKAKAIIEKQVLITVMKNQYGTIWDEYDRRKS